MRYFFKPIFPFHIKNVNLILTLNLRMKSHGRSRHPFAVWIWLFNSYLSPGKWILNLCWRLHERCLNSWIVPGCWWGSECRNSFLTPALTRGGEGVSSVLSGSSGVQKALPVHQWMPCIDLRAHSSLSFTLIHVMEKFWDKAQKQRCGCSRQIPYLEHGGFWGVPQALNSLG